MNIKEQFAAAKKAAEDILAKAETENRKATPAELEEAQKHIKEATRLKTIIDKADEAADIMGRLDGPAPTSFQDFGASLEFDVVGADGEVFSSNVLELLGASGTKDFKTVVSARLAGVAAKQLRQRVSLSPGTSKKDALIGATITLPGQFAAGVEGLPTEPTSILQLLDQELRQQSGVVDAGNRFSYLYESVFTNNAKSVPDGGTKPQSIVTYEEAVDTYRTFAHVSEPFPERYLEDYPTLIQLLQRELSRGVLESVETAILVGEEEANEESGRDDFDGILARAGLRVIPWQGSRLATVSHAAYIMDANHEDANAWAFHPADLHALTMLRENGTTGALLFGTGRTALSQFLGDAKIVTSSALTPGTAILGNWGKAKLMTLGGVSLKIYQDATLVEKNQFKIRAEGRYGLKVLRPAAFAEVELADDES